MCGRSATSRRWVRASSAARRSAAPASRSRPSRSSSRRSAGARRTRRAWPRARCARRAARAVGAGARPGSGRAGHGDSALVLGSLWRDARLYRLAAMHMASMGLSVVVGLWVVTLLVRYGGYGQRAAGIVGSLTLLLALVSRPLAAALARSRPDATRTTIAASLLSAPRARRCWPRHRRSCSPCLRPPPSGWPRASRSARSCGRPRRRGRMRRRLPSG